MIAKDPGDDCFMLRSIMREHNCHQDYNIGRASQYWIAENLKDRVQEGPHLKVKEMREEVKRVWNVNVSFQKCKRWQLCGFAKL